MDQDNRQNTGVGLSGALKNDDTGVKFNDYRSPKSYYPKTSRMIQWVINYSGGYIKDEKQANYTLLGFAAVAIVISFFLFFGRGSDTSRTLQENFKNKPQFLP